MHSLTSNKITKSCLLSAKGMFWKSAVLLLVVLWLAPRIVRHVYFLGYHKSVYRHYPGKCSPVGGTENGSEDFHPIGGGLVLISSGLRYLVGPNHPGYEGRKGRILLLDTKEEHPTAVPLTVVAVRFDPDTFNPHGMTVYNTPEGRMLLYIINHLELESVVEKFSIDVSKKEATHIKTISDPLFTMPNDLVAVGEDELYITNYMSNKSIRKLDGWLQLHTGYIIYHGGSGGRTAYSNIQNPNGIVSTEDYRSVYVSALGDQQIMIFDADKGDLHLNRTIQMQSSVDNLHIRTVADSVVLYAGCIPVIHNIRAFLQNPSQRTAESQVLQITSNGDNEPDVLELFADDGKVISSSSVAMVIDNKLLIGSVASSAAICDMNCIDQSQL